MYSTRSSPLGGVGTAGRSANPCRRRCCAVSSAASRLLSARHARSSISGTPAGHASVILGRGSGTPGNERLRAVRRAIRPPRRARAPTGAPACCTPVVSCSPMAAKPVGVHEMRTEPGFGGSQIHLGADPGPGPPLSGRTRRSSYKKPHRGLEPRAIGVLQRRDQRRGSDEKRPAEPAVVFAGVRRYPDRQAPDHEAGGVVRPDVDGTMHWDVPDPSSVRQLVRRSSALTAGWPPPGSASAPHPGSGRRSWVACRA